MNSGELQALVQATYNEAQAYEGDLAGLLHGLDEATNRFAGVMGDSQNPHVQEALGRLRTAYSQGIASWETADNAAELLQTIAGQI